MEKRPENSVQAIVTDPPYGLKEYTSKETMKLRRRHGGVWRIPPSFDGCERSPLPRFTVLTDAERAELHQFFARFACLAFRILVPGGHIFIATNPLLSHLVYLPLIEAGFEKRGEIIRLVQTLRGGDRPKNAHAEFAGVTVMPRSAWEPWGLFRKPCEGRVQDNLRKWKTGGLRRISPDAPFCDVIQSAPTRPEERQLARHPSLKPQAFMRQLVRASLPLGAGVLLDPFMGGGSTIAAAVAVGYDSIGLEIDPVFFRIAGRAIPRLASLPVNGHLGGDGAVSCDRVTRQEAGANCSAASLLGPPQPLTRFPSGPWFGEELHRIIADRPREECLSKRVTRSSTSPPEAAGRRLRDLRSVSRVLWSDGGRSR
jgi:site-specific DNA-methyltransferase (adenine-specific)